MTNILGNFTSGLAGRAVKLVAIAAGAIIAIRLIRRR